MRLHVLCDLHLEFGWIEIPATNADVVVLAGDMSIGRRGCVWALTQFPSQPVVYILGNHEFYRHSLPDLTQTLKQETKNSHVHVLENESVEIGGYTILGCTLWTDFQLSGNAAAAMDVADGMMNDFRIIEFSPEKRELRAYDTAQLHTESVAWLRNALAKCNPARTIVVTHHAPSGRSEAPQHANSPLKPAFSSDLESLIAESRVPLWIYGHTHYNTDFTIGSTRVLTNQRGYPQEACQGFDPGLVIEV